MTIQYRCRCGQEVILRPRESTYLVVAAILSLSLLNAVFTGIVWWKLAHLESVGTAPPVEQGAPEPGAPGPGAGVDDVADATDAGDEPDPGVAEASTHENHTEPNDSAGLVTDLEDPYTRGMPGNGATHDPSPESAASLALTDTPGEVEPVPPPARRVDLPPPADCDGLALWLLLQSPPDAPADRAAVLLAAARWGSGFVRERAAQRLREDPGLGVLAAAVSDEARAAREPALRIDPGPNVPPRIDELLADLAGDWEARWERLLRFEHTPAATRAWVNDQRTGVGAPADVLLLVDLSESMQAEIASMRTVLGRMVPLTTAADGGWRWGWIGYRDEVVESTGLFDDTEDFLASLERWSAEGGGDVPEGVDRAVFEALRFGAVTWRKDARHRLLVVGDAPPPHARIEPMVSLVKAAHGSPERHEVNCLGIIREPQFPFVPGFEDLAAGAGGRCIYLRTGDSLADALWRVLAAALPDAWRGCPLE